MKRSEGKNIQTQHSDWLLAKAGRKTCTSRYGDRIAEFPEGEIFNLISNNTGESLKISISGAYVKPLKEINSWEAKCIGDYSWVEHVVDFHNIYSTNLQREVNEDTIVTLVYFKRLEAPTETSLKSDR